ncbi:hypothetical protein ISCGN_023748 [Ixodes scapularis]
MNTVILALLSALLVVSFAQKKGPGGGWGPDGTMGSYCFDQTGCLPGLCCLMRQRSDYFYGSCQPLAKVGQRCSPVVVGSGAFERTCPCENGQCLRVSWGRREKKRTVERGASGGQSAREEEERAARGWGRARTIETFWPVAISSSNDASWTNRFVYTAMFHRQFVSWKRAPALFIDRCSDVSSIARSAISWLRQLHLLATSAPARRAASVLPHCHFGFPFAKRRNIPFFPITPF